MFKPFMGIDVNVRNTEKSEIRILVYIYWSPKLSSHDDICVYTVDTKRRGDMERNGVV